MGKLRLILGRLRHPRTSPREGEPDPADEAVDAVGGTAAVVPGLGESMRASPSGSTSSLVGNVSSRIVTPQSTERTQTPLAGQSSTSARSKECGNEDEDEDGGGIGGRTPIERVASAPPLELSAGVEMSRRVAELAYKRHSSALGVRTSQSAPPTGRPDPSAAAASSSSSYSRPVPSEAIDIAEPVRRVWPVAAGTGLRLSSSTSLASTSTASFSIELVESGSTISTPSSSHGSALSLGPAYRRRECPPSRPNLDSPWVSSDRFSTVSEHSESATMDEGGVREGRGGGVAEWDTRSSSDDDSASQCTPIRMARIARIHHSQAILLQCGYTSLPRAGSSSGGASASSPLLSVGGGSTDLRMRPDAV